MKNTGTLNRRHSEKKGSGVRALIASIGDLEKSGLITKHGLSKWPNWCDLDQSEFDELCKKVTWYDTVARFTVAFKRDIRAIEPPELQFRQEYGTSGSSHIKADDHLFHLRNNPYDQKLLTYCRDNFPADLIDAVLKQNTQNGQYDLNEIQDEIQSIRKIINPEPSSKTSYIETHDMESIAVKIAATKGEYLTLYIDNDVMPPALIGVPLTMTDIKDGTITLRETSDKSSPCFRAENHSYRWRTRGSLAPLLNDVIKKWCEDSDRIKTTETHATIGKEATGWKIIIYEPPLDLIARKRAAKKVRKNTDASTETELNIIFAHDPASYSVMLNFETEVTLAVKNDTPVWKTLSVVWTPVDDRIILNRSDLDNVVQLFAVLQANGLIDPEYSNGFLKKLQEVGKITLYQRN